MGRTDDMISRAAAIDALTDTNLKRNLDSVYDGDMNRTRRAAQRVIAQLPAADAIPVEWFTVMHLALGKYGDIGSELALDWVLMQWKATKGYWQEPQKPWEIDEELKQILKEAAEKMEGKEQ